MILIDLSLYKDPNIKDIITLEVIGEVNSPGTITFEDLIESMSSVINKSGGLTDFASLESSYIIRDDSLLNFNFKNINSKKAFLRDGDIVVIVGKYEEITVIWSS